MSALFGFCGGPNKKHLSRMQEVLAHRGESVETHSSDQLSVGIWKSPWSIDLAGSGMSENKHGVIALAGFQTLGPSQQTVPLQQIAASLATNQRLPENLTGDFIIAFRSNDGRFFLVRDGAGARTAYYSQWKNRLFFASEPKGIWNLPGFPRRLEPNSVAKYLTFSFVPGEATMLQDIKELCPGHCLTLQTDGSLSTERYFRFEEVQKDESAQFSMAESVSQFRHEFSAAVSDRLALIGNRSPVVFLSGGLDSSVVAAELVRQSSKKVKTFSLHFGNQYPSELEHARLVADKLGTDHEEVLIQPKDFVGNMRKMIWHLDDPIGDPITMPNFELARYVGERTQFVFNGEGGDPCFGGPKNISMMLLHWYGGERAPLFQENAYLASYRRAYEELDHIFTSRFRKKLELDTLPRILTPFFKCDFPRNYLDKLTAINIRLKGAHLILPKVERMLAASGVSPLSPLFSSEMVRFSFQIPSKMKLEHGIEKIVIKEAFRDVLPKQIIHRPKSGMRVPVHFWFQGELKNYARKVLSPKAIKTAGIFDHRRVKKLLNYSIEEGNGRYGMRLWMLLTFEIWRRMVIEGKQW